jgi:CheY-like chemotaxis protein
VVADIGMPGKDGYDLIQYIRSLPPDKGSRVLVVALTAFARVEDRVKVLAAEYQMHVQKPIEPGELLTLAASLTSFTNSFTNK